MYDYLSQITMGKIWTFILWTNDQSKLRQRVHENGIVVDISFTYLVRTPLYIELNGETTHQRGSQGMPITPLNQRATAMRR